jgi:protein gp37
MNSEGKSEVNERYYRERTWNVIVGCSRVSAGCDNCYAIPESRRMSRNPNITNKYGTNPYDKLIQIRNGGMDFSESCIFSKIGWKRRYE